MTRDYKNVTVPGVDSIGKTREKSKPRKSRSRVSENPSSDGLPVWFWLISGVVIGSFVSFLVYLKLSVNVESDVVEAIQKKITLPTKSQNETSVKTQSDEAQKDEKGRFQFYEILPERFIEVPVEKVEPEAEQKTTNAKSIQSSKSENEPATAFVPEKTERGGRSYVLQVGSFSRFQEADKRKATLAFMGISSKIYAVSKNDRTIYRVQVGPYRDIKKINGISSVLKENKIPSLLMKVKG